VGAAAAAVTCADHDAGYWWDISMRQVEIAKTITFTTPRHARAFFEALAADNLDIGRPDNMEIIFNRQIRSTTKGVFRTAVDRDNDGVVPERDSSLRLETRLLC